MLKIDADFITQPRVDKTISRIYRDTRFSKDKSLFRDTAWLTFARKRGTAFGGESAYFFEISPSGYRYGVGYYEAGTKAMEILRMLIDRGDPSFIKALAAFKAQNAFNLEGDSYKKSRYGGADEALRQWYDKKSVYLCRSGSDCEFLFSDRLAAEVERDFTAVAEVYRFFREIEKYRQC